MAVNEEGVAGAADPAIVERFHVRALDGLRFVAFLLVLLHHLPPLADPGLPRLSSVFAGIHTLGWIGVDLFLCLSAFLLTRLAILERVRSGTISLRRFWMRRILRIWPLYFLALFIGFVVMPWLGPPSVGPSFGSEAYDDMVRLHLLPLALFVDNYASGLFNYPASLALNLLWTISLEEQFYLALPLILPLLFALGSRARWALILGFVAYGIGLRAAVIAMGLPHIAFYANPFTHAEPMIAGMVLAFLVGHARLDVLRHWWVPIPAVLLIALQLSLPTIFERSFHMLWQFGAIAAAIGMIVGHLAVNPDSLLARGLGSAPVAWAGRISFGLYVYHHWILGIAATLVPATNTDVRPWLFFFAASLAATIVISALSYYLYERPFLLLKRRFEIVPSRRP